VRDALHAFRALVGKAPPDDPAQAKLVLPAEQAALEVYGARIERMLAARRDAGETQGEATANSDEPGDKVGS
jgi:hypothetical protein